MSLAISPPWVDSTLLGYRRVSGIGLLRGFILLLTESGITKPGFTRRKVNELHRDSDGLRIRYGYAGGEFRLQVTRQPDLCPCGPEGTRFTVKYDIRHPMPTLGQLVRATVDGPPADWSPDANNEMSIRGEAQDNG